ncbi:MAG: carboxylesterase family protein [Candidatus Limnocylindrales bacterium]
MSPATRTLTLTTALALAMVPSGAVAEMADEHVTRSLQVRQVRNVPFESSSLNALGRVDVYAPTTAGRWPVVVMFHGDPMAVSKEYLTSDAIRVASRGAVVFVPTWGRSGGDEYDTLMPGAQIAADGAQAMCAVSFAQERAPGYGGDDGPIVLFGHSAGAMIASVLAFARPPASDGCLANGLADRPRALVTWEGDWLMTSEFWDFVLPIDPQSVLEGILPWAHLAKAPDLPVFVLTSDEPGLGERRVGSGEAPEDWLRLRDPDGRLLEALHTADVIDDEVVELDEQQWVFAQALLRNGNPVAYRVMPGSSHEQRSAAGDKVFLDTIALATSMR